LYFDDNITCVGIVLSKEVTREMSMSKWKLISEISQI